MSFTLSSDQHAHSWTQFARVNEAGVNTRLAAILNEFRRQADCSILMGHKRMVFAGDLFHVRGRIEPEVFNPTHACLKEIAERGVEIIAIPGNHDLQGKEASALGNAMQTLGEIKNFRVVTKPELIDDVIMIPWIEDLAQLRDKLSKLAGSKQASKLDVVIHAPVNGVLKGLPDHGLEASELQALGFRRVFAGHYHNALELLPGVYSVGATTHQTWSDPDTNAGFWMVDGGACEFSPTSAPLFVNQATTTVDENAVKGNYVRIQLKEADADEIDKLRRDLIDAGAAGVVDHASRKRTTTRTGSVAAAGATIEASVGEFIDKELETKLDKSRITIMSMEVLRTAQQRIAA